MFFQAASMTGGGLTIRLTRLQPWTRYVLRARNAREEKDFAQTARSVARELIPFHKSKPARVNPIKLAYDDTTHVGWMAGPIATSAFNQLCQYTSSSGHRVYCYAELAVSSLAVVKTITSTHCAYPRPRRDGQAE